MDLLLDVDWVNEHVLVFFLVFAIVGVSKLLQLLISQVFSLSTQLVLEHFNLCIVQTLLRMSIIAVVDVIVLSSSSI